MDAIRLSEQLRGFVNRSRALSPTDLGKITTLADQEGIVFVRLEPKGAVLDDVLTGIYGVLHATPEVVVMAIETFLQCEETQFSLEILPLGVGIQLGYEVRFKNSEP